VLDVVDCEQLKMHAKEKMSTQSEHEPGQESPQDAASMFAPFEQVGLRASLQHDHLFQILRCIDVINFGVYKTII
jgi:hypothetical protein